MYRSSRSSHSLEDRSRRRRQRFTEDKLVKIRTERTSGLFKTCLAAMVILIQLGIIVLLISPSAGICSFCW